MTSEKNGGSALTTKQFFAKIKNKCIMQFTDIRYKNSSMSVPIREGHTRDLPHA